MELRIGSSPRMRGTRGRELHARSPVRFIPAYAGNTRKALPELRVRSVHPRVCGEHPKHKQIYCEPFGSSPRMRGTRGRAAMSPRPNRFIPAYAGNTQWTGQAALPRSVHPRVCGEHKPSPDWWRRNGGSSPRMRGTQANCRHRHPRLRFIPAYAGNTAPLPIFRRMSTVHPRVCGEHAAESKKKSLTDGSSPRMRGTLQLCP